MFMAIFISHSAEETAALGEQWGGEAKPGWVIGLTGDLGAGKTQLVKGLARGLGISARVQSPTFALVHEYHEGRLPLFHVDLYRLDTPAQIVGAGLLEYFRPEGVAVIEWSERWPDFASQKPSSSRTPPSEFEDHRSPSAERRGPWPLFRRVLIEPLGETERRITYEDLGA
jgi:tRNA threonylcarbamoyladenosine biosynthesis protein TsaE